MIPEDCFYTEHHIWIKSEQDVQLVGVTEPVLRWVGPVVSLTMLDADDPIMPDIPWGELEGYRYTRQLYLPREAQILEVHDEVLWTYEKLEKDPYGEGWLMRVRIEDFRQLLMQLMPVHVYREFVAESLGKEFADE
jgi:glycine cleavage system H protein